MMTLPDTETQGLIDSRIAMSLHVDRRHARGVVDGELCVAVSWTESCSGCFEAGECMGLARHYPYDNKAKCYVGFGCEECGYSGKRRVAMWQPAGMFYSDVGWDPDRKKGPG